MLDLHFFQAAFQHLDFFLQQPAVGFQLGLARPAQADRTAALALEVGPAANQSRSHVLQLGEFDLQLAFERRCALREDVEDQTRAIDHASTQRFFQIAFLAGRQQVIHQDQIGAAGLAHRLGFLELAAADVGRRIRFVDARGQRRDDGRASGAGEVGEFFEQGRVLRPEAVGLDQQRDLTLAGPIKHGCGFRDSASAIPTTRHHSFSSSPPSSSSPPPAVATCPPPGPTRTLRAGTTVEMACL